MASVGYAGLLAVQCSSEGPYVGGGAGGSFSALAAAYSLYNHHRQWYDRCDYRSRSPHPRRMYLEHRSSSNSSAD